MENTRSPRRNRKKEGYQLRYVSNARGRCAWCHAAVEGEAVEELESIKGIVFTYLYHPRCFVRAKMPFFERLKGAVVEVCSQ